MVRCFLIEPTGECQRFLRRYDNETGNCRPRSYCNGMTFLDRVPTPKIKDYVDGTQKWDAADHRWPIGCLECGYVFQATDAWQVFILEIWKRSDGQPGEYSIHPNPHPPAERAPAGAMWFADYHTGWKGPDGHTVVVMLPDGTDWCVDGPSSQGGRWQRHGIPPDLVASPSIQTGTWHGHLGGSDGSKPGYLVEC